MMSGIVHKYDETPLFELGTSENTLGLLSLEHQKTSVEMTDHELETEKMQLYKEILRLKQDIESGRQGHGQEDSPNNSELDEQTVDDIPNPDSKALKAATKKRRENLLQDLSPKNKSYFFNSEEEHREELEANNIEIGSEEIMDMKPQPKKAGHSKKARPGKNQLAEARVPDQKKNGSNQESKSEKNPTKGDLVLESFDDSSSNQVESKIKTQSRVQDVPSQISGRNFGELGNVRRDPEARNFGAMRLGDQRAVIIPPTGHARAELGQAKEKKKKIENVKEKKEEKGNTFEDEEWVF